MERRFGGGGKMVVELIKDKELWDEFVDKSPYGLLFHKWDFLKIMEKFSGYKLLSYGIYKGDELIAVFPLFFNKSKGLKKIFSPPPRTGVSYLGFVMDQKYDTLKQDKKESYLNIVADEIDEEIEKFSPNYVAISIVPNFLDIRPFKWNNYNIDTHFTYTINLSRTLDEIGNNLKKILRKQIKKAEDLNLKLLKSDDISMFYELEKKRYEEQSINFPIKSKEYLQDLIKAYPENFGLYYLYDSNEEVIGAITTQEYKRFILWMGNTKIKNEIYGNEYIIWKLIQKAKSENYQKFEIIGANIKRLCQFKSKFNPSLELSFSLYKKDALGKLAEWAYLNFLRKRWF